MCCSRRLLDAVQIPPDEVEHGHDHGRDARVVVALRLDNLQEPAAGGKQSQQIHTADYKQIKARFSGFNKALERLFHAQKMYSVPNNNLREELRELAKSMVVPQYEAFVERYRDVPFTTNRSKYEQYTVETLVEILGKFFQK